MQHTVCTHDERRSSIQVKHVSRETEVDVDVDIDVDVDFDRALFGRRHNTQLLLAVSRRFRRPHDHWKSTAGLCRVLEHTDCKAHSFSTRGAVYTSSKGGMVLQKERMSIEIRRRLSSHWTTTPYLIASCISTGSTQGHSAPLENDQRIKTVQGSCSWTTFLGIQLECISMQ